MNSMKLPIEDLRYQAVTLPEEIKMYHYSGDFSGELAAIDRWMARDLPLCLQKRLEIQRIFAAQLIGDYPLSRADVLRELGEVYPTLEAGVLDRALDDFLASGNVDYILRGGRLCFQHKAVSNILKTHAGELEALVDPARRPEAAAAFTVPEHILAMREQGSLAYRYEVEFSMRLTRGAERPGETLRVWFPYPVACASQPASEIRLLSSSHPVILTGSEHRTAFMEVPCEAGATYSVRYCFVNRARYVCLDGHRPTGMAAGEGLPEEQRARYTAEQAPHILFTPFIRMLAQEIAGEETDPLRLARRVYDYICAHVRYSYVRDYLLIENIPEFVLTNGYGDCGTMALAFITLCRALGIPAKWQSGCACYPDEIGSHDWAMFYVAPYGWLYCDPSYGEGAARSGNKARKDHYFGNLDPFRLVASNEFQQPLTPDKSLCRMDPYDNQCGEAEYTDGVHNIFFDDRTYDRRVLSVERLSPKED